VGLLLSDQGSLFQICQQVFQGSILVGTLARLFSFLLYRPLVVHPPDGDWMAGLDHGVELDTRWALD